MLVRAKQRRSTMDTKRKGEIAYLFLKNNLRKNGVRLGQHTRREIGNVAKELGISFEEAFEFAEELTRELFDEAFAEPAD